MFEIEVLVGVLIGHFNEGLARESRMVNIFLKFQKSVKGSSKELWVAKSVRNILIFLFWFNRNIVFVSFPMVIVSGNWSIQALLLPLSDMLERNWLIPDGICDKSIFVGERPIVFIVNISAGEAQIR